jgi:hypothetical protein
MKSVVLVLVMVMAALWAAGCGSVYLQGEAMTAAESSALDAAGFAERVEVDGNASPLVRAYAVENAEQWRYFVRSAKKDQSWGPKLPGDANQ